MSEIKVREIIDRKWWEWLNEFATASEAAGGIPTSAMADQSELSGILSEISSSNVTLIAVTRIEGAPSQQIGVQSETGRRLS